MSKKLPKLGKISPEFFDKVIFPRLGAENKSVLVKPKHGVDFGVIEVGNKVLVMSADPFFISPSLGWERAAWFALHILASDVAVSGIKPSYMAIDLNLPPEMGEDVLEKIWKVVDKECKKLGIAVVTGHTARYAGCNYPMVGGATIFGVGSKKDLIAPNAKAGDLVIITKGAGIEASALMAAQFPEFLEKEYGKDFVKKSEKLFYQMSVVKDALTAAKVGGVTSMHDATECGVFGGLYEIANVNNLGMKISLEDIIIREDVGKICKYFKMDPYKSISEGTMIATVNPKKAPVIINALKKEGIPASVAGQLKPRKHGIRIIDGNKEYELKHPKTDPFWIRFEEYLNKQK